MKEAPDFLAVTMQLYSNLLTDGNMNETDKPRGGNSEAEEVSQSGNRFSLTPLALVEYARLRRFYEETASSTMRGSLQF
jgi:hypothetical protein